MTTNSNSATIGVQGAFNGANTRYTEISCDTSGISTGMQFNLTLPDCPAFSILQRHPQPARSPSRTYRWAAPSTRSSSVWLARASSTATHAVDQVSLATPPTTPTSARATTSPEDSSPRLLLTLQASTSPQEPSSTRMYAVGSTFFDFIWRLSDRGYVTGYPCGGPGEPCGPNNLPYFRPNANVTRGQLSKIDANAAGFNETPGAQQYEDVLPGSTFYDFIWRLSDTEASSMVTHAVVRVSHADLTTCPTSGQALTPPEARRAR